MARRAEKKLPSNTFVDDGSREGSWTRFAHRISAVTHPLFVAFPTFFLIALSTAPDLLHAFLWWMVTTVGITLAPLLFIRRGVRLGHYSDHHVSVREQRFLPMVFGSGCVGSVFVLLLCLHASQALLATVTAALVVCACATLITLRWKISIHLVGIAGAVTALSLILGPLFLLLSPLVLLVGWARWQVRAHTLLQALAGTILAVGITVALFQFFR